jgi:hypothetical protein
MSFKFNPFTGSFDLDGGEPGPPGPGTDLSYAPSTREIKSSSGNDTKLPLASPTNAGLQPAAGFGSIAYAATVDLDLAVLDGQMNAITLTGALALTASNLVKGCQTGLLLIAGASDRNITFPIDWKPFGTLPASIPANKEAVFSLACWGPAQTDVKFVLVIQP